MCSRIGLFQKNESDKTVLIKDCFQKMTEDSASGWCKGLLHLQPTRVGVDVHVRWSKCILVIEFEFLYVYFG